MPKSPVASHIATLEALCVQADKGFQKAAWFIGLWGLTAGLLAAFLRVDEPIKPDWEQKGFDAHHGYFWSLFLVIVPILVLLDWYRKSRTELNLRGIMKAVLQTAIVVAVAWVFLDIFFANLFFTFPSPSAHRLPLFLGYTWNDGCRFWMSSCYERNIPGEELIFYLGSAFVLNMMYMWVTEDFLSVYAWPRPDYERAAQTIGPLVKWNGRVALLGAGLFAGVLLMKKVIVPLVAPNPLEFTRFLVTAWSTEGWPFYFLAQLLILFVPLSAFLTQTRRFTNPRAFLFLVFVTAVISLAWEATLAIRYGWWGYQSESMIGLFIKPWWNLPIEAPLLWVSTGGGVMVVYEAAKVKALSRRSWPQALAGVDTWWAAILTILRLRRQPA